MDYTFLTLGLFLIGMGFLLILAELFVTSGVMLVLALGSIVVGIVFLFKYDTMIGIYGLVGVLIALPVGSALILRLLPHTPLGRLAARPEEEIIDAFPNLPEMLALKGRTGKTLTEMRPAGMVEFDGRRIDCITEGMMVEQGCWVRCIEVRGNNVIVRPVESPDTFDLETAQFS